MTWKMRLLCYEKSKDGAKGIFINDYSTCAANSIIDQMSVYEDGNNDWTIEN